MPHKTTKKRRGTVNSAPRAKNTATRPAKQLEQLLQKQTSEIAGDHADLHESEQWVRAIYDQAYEFIGLLEPDGTLIDANRTALAFRDVELSDVVGKPFWETPWWDLSQEHRMKLKAAIADAARGRFIRITAQHRAQDGAIEDIDFSLTPITDRTGKVTHIIPEGRRITTLMRVQDQLRQAHADLERRVQEREADLERATATMRENEERWRLFIEHAPAAIAMLDRDMRYLAVSRRWMDDYGLTGRIFGRSHYDVFPEIPPRWKEVHRRALAGETLRADADPFVRAEGSTQWLKWEVRPWYRRGEVGGILIATEDVTGREQAKNALREREALNRAFLENSATMAWMKDTQGRYVYLSSNYERRFGIRFDDWGGKTDFELWPREVAAVFRANDEAVLRENHVIEVVEEAQTPDGSRSWWLNHKFSYQDSAGKRYVGGLGVEITDRKRAEEELRQSQDELQKHREQLQNLTSKLIDAQEQERRRIARELHDDFSQRLAAMVLDLAAVEKRCSVSPEANGHAMEQIRGQLELLADDVHSLAYKLHPSLLEHAGLQAAVEDHVQQVMKRSGLRIILKVQQAIECLSQDQSTCLFRVLQESLHNIVKHAQATEVMIKLSGSSKGVGLSVTDNGKGFDTDDKSAHQKGLGLISMEERLRLLKGFLRVHSRPAGGTKVCAWIPYAESTS